MYRRTHGCRPETARLKQDSRGGYLSRYNAYMTSMDYRRYMTSSFDSMRCYGPDRKKPTANERDEKIRGKKKKGGGESDKTTKEKDKFKDEKEKEKKKPKADKEELSKELHVTSVDLHILKNARKHHTIDYDNTKKRKNPEGGEDEEAELVVRRGQAFTMTVTLDRPYDKKNHDMKLVFKTGDRPRPNKGTAVQVKVEESSRPDDDDDDQWSAKLVKEEGNSVELRVYISASCVIGVWDIGITTITDVKYGFDKVYLYQHPDDIFILLNPWSPDDSVYMAPPVLLDEYVLNDKGAVFRGNSKQIGTKVWNFAQFEDGILEICLHLIRKANNGIVDKAMNDPIKLSRAISRIVNNCDEGGVLEGRWDGEYKPHKRPGVWGGSENILRQYAETGEPVKYGQCWVFSAVTTTVCRAIGLPCRSVTNFSSAHDTDGSLTIDSVGCVDCKTNAFEPFPDESDDSVWNFHVWNDVWMSRPDLVGYDGWQAIDATPQERSDGAFRCGPAPLKAIKNGDCNVPYDTGFIFAEINADRVKWVKIDDCNYEIYDIDKRSVGKRLSTKTATGKAIRGSLSLYRGDKNKNEEDVIYQYKYPEGSSEERRSVENASRFSTSVRNPYKEKKKEIDCVIESKDKIMIGEDFSATVRVKNMKKSTKKATVTVIVRAVAYTGRALKVVKKYMYEDVQLKGLEEECFDLPVCVSDYLNLLDEHSGMRVCACVCVKDEEMVSTESDFRLRVPDLEITAPEECRVGDKVDITVSFTNPIPKVLTDCNLELEGAGFTRAEEFKQRDVSSKSEWKFKTSIYPLKSGERQISANFDCDELPEITGFVVIDVKDR